MLEHFAQDAAVAGADDQHIAGVRMAGQGRVHHRLVVEELIARGHLGDAIEQQDIAEFLALDDLQVLPLGLAPM